MGDYRIPNDLPKLISDVWAADNNTAYAVAGADVWVYEGGVWQTMTAEGLDEISWIDDIFGLSPTNIFATAYLKPNGQKVVLHYDGARWTTSIAPDRYADIYWGTLGREFKIDLRFNQYA
ncbi:MAG: hypothetical protein M5R36_28605 [Deltaproteobacteria bacterium]|nr:hypothetical protein [Deltaproteobacteria bacterium]